ncbi:MAG: zinc ribbon domain-containing protein [Clostridia bacterium]|nr:zinc ribbon domain-containing protein [Clostridia bacterium]
MKCPNCSFVNPDASEICKVCGYELIAISTEKPEPPISKAPPKINHTDHADDHELDSALKTLFGSDFDDDSDIIDIELTENDPELDYYEEHSSIKPFLILGALALLVIVLFMFLKSNWSDFPWSYESSADQPGQTIEVPGPTDETKDKTAQDSVDQFFTLLPTFVNQGNISILTLFSNSEDALEALMDFSANGTFEQLNQYDVKLVEEDPEAMRYSVTTEMERTLDDKKFEEQMHWDFRVIRADDAWTIEYFSVEVLSGDPVATEPAPSDPAAPAPTPTPTPQPKPEPAPVEPEISGEIPEGFLESGTFSGGKITDGQDVATARYGRHEDFERIVFDIYGWTSFEPTETVDEIGVYEATISGDGKSITVIINGARGAYAKKSGIDLKESSTVSSVEYFFPGSDSAVGITITLNEKGAFKVFSLKEPAKLVVDFLVTQ